MMFFGLGLMTDDSPYTYNNFNFVIGLPDENGGIYQLDTPDIAWSNFVARYGYVGTFAYLVFYIGLAWFFFDNRKINYHCLFYYICCWYWVPL